MNGFLYLQRETKIEKLLFPKRSQLERIREANLSKKLVFFSFTNTVSADRKYRCQPHKDYTGSHSIFVKGVQVTHFVVLISK